LNCVEFFCWLGLPMALLVLLSAGDSVRNIMARKFNTSHWSTVFFVLVLAGLALFGQTKGEVARLWIFMIPPMCIVAAAGMVRRFQNNIEKASGYIIGLQFITILLMKYFRDFW